MTSSKSRQKPLATFVWHLVGPWLRGSMGMRDASACSCLLLLCTLPHHLDISKACFVLTQVFYHFGCTFPLFLYVCCLWSKPVLLFIFCIRGSSSLATSKGFSLPPPPPLVFFVFLFLEESLFIPQSIIYHLYFFWHMKILNLSLLYVFFLLVVGPHSPRPISCVFSDADVCNEREHLGAPQRKHSNSTITRATVLNGFEGEKKKK